VDISYKIKQC